MELRINWVRINDGNSSDQDWKLVLKVTVAKPPRKFKPRPWMQGTKLLISDYFENN